MRGYSRNPPELIRKAKLAKFVNELMGTTRYTAWNIDEIPWHDLDLLDDWVRYQGQYRAFDGKLEPESGTEL